MQLGTIKKRAIEACERAGSELAQQGIQPQRANEKSHGIVRGIVDAAHSHYQRTTGKEMPSGIEHRLEGDCDRALWDAYERDSD